MYLGISGNAMLRDMPLLHFAHLHRTPRQLDHSSLVLACVLRLALYPDTLLGGQSSCRFVVEFFAVNNIRHEPSEPSRQDLVRTPPDVKCAGTDITGIVEVQQSTLTL